MEASIHEWNRLV